MFLEFGIDPRAMDTMSLYEIVSMQIAFSKRGKPSVTDEEFAEGMTFMKGALARFKDVKI